MMKNYFGHSLAKVLLWLAVALLVMIAVVVVLPILNLPLGVKIYSVQSGSMEPVIKVGGIVMVKPFSEYQPQEIISFTDPDQPDQIITHRLDGIDSDGHYLTKGDANDVVDSQPVDKSKVVGKVIFSLPYFGYFVAFAKTLPGLILLIILPAVLIIFTELKNIKLELSKMKKPSQETGKPRGIKLFIFLLFLVLSGLLQVGISNSYLSDQLVIKTNTITAGYWLKPEAEFYLRSDGKAVSFSVTNIAGYNFLDYKILYSSNGKDKGITGSVPLGGINQFERNDLLLGTCSSVEGLVCVYDEGITEIKLKLVLTKFGEEVILEKSILP